LRRKCSEQTSRSRSERRNSPLRSESTVQLGENRHGQPSRARSSTLGESVKPRRICDQNLFPDSRIWRPERQQVEQPAVVDLEKWRHIGRFFSGGVTELGCGQSVPQTMRSGLAARSRAQRQSLRQDFRRLSRVKGCTRLQRRRPACQSADRRPLRRLPGSQMRLAGRGAAWLGGRAAMEPETMLQLTTPIRPGSRLRCSGICSA